MTELNTMQALEVILKEKCKEATKFPRMHNDYFIQYCSFLNKLRVDIYPQIDTGLGVNSKNPGYYTAHNAEHFDEVVRYAGDLLNANIEDIANWKILQPYELYILLVAIRIHDVGNIHGRDDHEKKCFQFLREHSELLGGDTSELKIIARIAEAHGGKVNGSRDTIGTLNTNDLVGTIRIRSRLLAAIVRFADEICENSGRAAKYLLKHGNLPAHNLIYHKYAASILGSVYGSDDKRVNIQFVLTTDDVSQSWGCEDRKQEDGSFINSVYLIDEILDRLEKMDRERKYCNIHTRGTYAVESIRASIEIVDAKTHETLEKIPVPELMDEGYPENVHSSLKVQLKAYCGSDYAAKYITTISGESNGK
ncbi:hypothetical protein J1G18_19025 [Pseudomonas sp. MIS38]|uniref:HD domain-containing protein n=1 Tax=Pseudomonas sp. MIS38 TaxID=91465 RepID=UPI001CA60526|nr:hypothetical protein [Pseudomonas sp. MIS38]MBY8959388.1 hypothetical protein [Pseudomonas sp. MIS38]